MGIRRGEAARDGGILRQGWLLICQTNKETIYSLSHAPMDTPMLIMA